MIGVKKYPGQFKQEKIIDVWLSNNQWKVEKIYIKVMKFSPCNVCDAGITYRKKTRWSVEKVLIQNEKNKQKKSSYIRM